ncbi:MAG: sugar phosphate isomerase/epimerase [Ruminococcaceae bacterium]|nr:sugar phosphate isomerase/epimerase [Oscillospiraceae bacterium]
MEYGIQMYSVRDITKDDLAGALKKVAEIGYKWIEFAGFFGHSAEDVKAMLDEYGLKISSTHSGLGDLDNDFAGTVKYHKTIGNTNYIVPGAPYDTKEALDLTIEKLNKYKPMLEAEGITLAYHNHHREFLPNQDGQIAHAEMEARTTVNFQIDTYWAFVGDRDPVETITRLKDRVKIIHLKDGTKGGHGLALGEGECPVKAVRKAAIDFGMRMIVESEGCDPTGIEEVTRCFKYLDWLDSVDRI